MESSDVVTMIYDASGRLTAQVGGLRPTTTTTYVIDALGGVVMMTDPTSASGNDASEASGLELSSNDDGDVTPDVLIDPEAARPEPPSPDESDKDTEPPAPPDRDEP
jgi:hypothetical protein